MGEHGGDRGWGGGRGAIPQLCMTRPKEEEGETALYTIQTIVYTATHTNTDENIRQILNNINKNNVFPAKIVFLKYMTWYTYFY